MSLTSRNKGRSLSRNHFNFILKRFLLFLKRELRITYDIPIVLIDDSEFSKKLKAFGELSNNIIYVSIINRHPVDILRTIAHECIHYKQHIEGKKGSSHPGSLIENQANAKAGELIRRYGNIHPELFDLTTIKL